jgi:hypothetical protein
MAKTKAKRSAHATQSRRHSYPARREDRRYIQFADAKGKIIDTVELLTAPDYHSISINFKDKTCLNFSVETGFTVKTDYCDWKTGEQRILRKWPIVRSGRLR